MVDNLFLKISIVVFYFCVECHVKQVSWHLCAALVLIAVACFIYLIDQT